MVSQWNTPKLLPSTEFDEFLVLYKAYLEDKTADPLRLSVKVQKQWDNLSKEKKKEWTERLIEAGVFDIWTVKKIRMFGGTLYKVVAF
jgi:hypothetical protein